MTRTASRSGPAVKRQEPLGPDREAVLVRPATRVLWLSGTRWTFGHTGQAKPAVVRFWLKP